MKTMHLFAGVGGGLYADLIIGHKPVCAVELNPYRCDDLRERAEDGTFPGLHVHEGDVREFDPSPWIGGVDQISAGFPCTDISCAGKGAGIAGPQSGLWSEVVRCVRILRPGLVFLENSPAITSRGLYRVLGDLASLGYDAEWCVLGADEVGAPHIRDRWWCLAYLDNMWELQSSGGESDERGRALHEAKETSDLDIIGRNRGTGMQWPGRWKESQDNIDDSHVLNGNGSGFYPGSIPQFKTSEVRGCEEVADSSCNGRLPLRTESEGQQGETCACWEAEPTSNSSGNRSQGSIQQSWLPEADREAIQAVKGYCGTRDWNPSFTNFLGVVHGLPSDVNAHKGKRIEGLGDAQVPLQAATAWSILMRSVAEARKSS